MELSYPDKREARDVIEKTPVPRCKRTKRVGKAVDGWRNRLYHGDNLHTLKMLLEDSDVRGKVQLVYIDPPYATRRSFTHRKKTEAIAYDDQLNGYQFVEWLRQRIILLRELLSEDGAIYVHLDDKMVFHIKVIMDEIFGAAHFRNLIVRKKCHSKNYTRKQFGNTADYILYYVKSRSPKWNRPYETENIYSFEQRFPRIDPETGRRFALVPVHAPGVRNGETGNEWRGMKPPKGKHWQVRPSELDRLDEAGEIYWSPTGNPRRKIFADKSPGVPVQDIWMKFMDFQNQNMKETGYPTEKHPALLRRIIEASSGGSDLVLDAFGGSGTTLAVAQQLGRRWIGVDSSPMAIETMVDRLQRPPSDVDVDDDQLALFDQHEGKIETPSSSSGFDVFETS